jgi:G3E family GTPase
VVLAGEKLMLSGMASSLSADAMKGETAPDKASVIIVTGFLGSGKTTLVNRLLTAEHGRRIAVVVNEFGEVGIDHHLLISGDQEVIQMNNGCICCTVRGDLLRSLFDLAERRAQFDTVIIETTGLAEPAPVAQALYADERIRREFSLAGVVTLVDAKHVTGQLEDTVEAKEQIAFADLIVLNKTDLATTDELDQIEARIGGLNKLATICRTKNSELDLELVFGVQNAGLEQKIEAAIGDADTHHCEGEHCDHESHHHNGHHHHGADDHDRHHLNDIMTVCIAEPGELDALKVSQWFRSLAGELGAGLLRMKGILNLRGDAEQFMFQGVQMEFEGRPGRPWEIEEERTNKLVFIGRKLDGNKITRGFKGCLAAANSGEPGPADPFGREQLEISPRRLDQIRYWMRQNFAFPKEAPIVIKEVPCVKPSCPPIETAIVAILKSEPPRYFKVQHPIDEITFDHVYDLIENPMPCC